MGRSKSSSNARPRIEKRSITGILLLDKPVGITSNRALQIVKRLYRASKAGHTGSLDPLASGMLPLCFGQATKVSHWLLNSNKTYEVEAFIGAQTDTADADGEVIERSERASVTLEMLEAAIQTHLGDIDQVPPMYSALKKDGKRLYELARAGQVVERAARKVHIFEIRIVKFDPQRPVLMVRCSKGTYIRTLVETLAEAMGTLAHVTALRRTALEPFEAQSMVTMEELEPLAEDQGALDELLLPADVALTPFPAVHLTQDEAFYLGNGHPVGHAPAEITGLTRIYDHNERFLGVGEVLPDGRVAPKRLFTGA